MELKTQSPPRTESIGPTRMTFVWKIVSKHPTMMAHESMKTRETKFSHNTGRGPYFSEAKLSGMVIKKSDFGPLDIRSLI